jgi:chromosome segregation ATPase
MDNTVIVAIFGFIASIVASQVAANMQMKRWKEAERQRTENEGNKAGAEATKSYADAAGKMAELSDKLSQELMELSGRLSELEKDNRLKGKEIASLLTEKESWTAERGEMKNKIADQEDRIIDMAKSIGTWQLHHHEMKRELEDVRKWAEELVSQVIYLGGTPKKLERSTRNGVTI